MNKKHRVRMRLNRKVNIILLYVIIIISIILGLMNIFNGNVIKGLEFLGIGIVVFLIILWLKKIPMFSIFGRVDPNEK
jgi:hypothetical protein